MNTKNKTLLSAAAFSLIFAGAANATLLTETDIDYWKVATTQASVLADNFWSSSGTETVPATLTAEQLANSVISSLVTGTTPCKLPATGDYTIKGIYLKDSFVYSMYNDIANTTLTLADGITVKNGTVANMLTIRRKNAANNFTINVGDINIIDSSGTVARFGTNGTSNNGEWINALNLRGDVNMRGVSSSSIAALDIYTANFTMSTGKSISLNNAQISFKKAANIGAQTADFKTPDVDLSGVTINLSGSSMIQYGMGYTNLSTGKVDFGNVNLTSADVSSELVVYTTVSSDDPTTVGNITSTEDGVAGSFFALRFNFAAISVGDVNLSVEKFNFFGTGSMNSYANNYTAGDAHFNIGSVGYVYINSALENNGSLVLGGSGMTNLNTGNKNYYVEGLSGTGSRITTSYNSATGDIGNTGTATLILRGTDTGYSTDNALIDMAADANTSAMGKTGALALTVNLGVNTTQYIRTSSYYRGDTTVNSGRLYLNADGSTRATAGDWGVGSVILNGGSLGAISENNDYGTIIANDITFAGGMLMFDISDAGHDFIKLLSSTPLTAASSDLVSFEFSIFDITQGEMYKILEWDSSVDMSAFDPDNFTATIIGADDLEAAFSFAADGTGLNVSFYQIPEPSQVAALIGLVALFMAVRRRRK